MLKSWLYFLLGVQSSVVTTAGLDLGLALHFMQNMAFRCLQSDRTGFLAKFWHSVIQEYWELFTWRKTNIFKMKSSHNSLGQEMLLKRWLSDSSYRHSFFIFITSWLIHSRGSNQCLWESKIFLALQWSAIDWHPFLLSMYCIRTQRSNLKKEFKDKENDKSGQSRWHAPLEKSNTQDRSWCLIHCCFFASVTEDYILWYASWITAKKNIAGVNQKAKQKVWCKTEESKCNTSEIDTMNGAVTVNPESKMDIIVRYEN